MNGIPCYNEGGLKRTQFTRNIQITHTKNKRKKLIAVIRFG